MAQGGTDYAELNRRLMFEADGLLTRRSRSWTRDKLALLAYYLPGFAKLCSEKAKGWYFVDGFAGSGANRAPGFPLAKGSAVLGVSQTPPPTASILIEKDESAASALRTRAARFGGNTFVFQGDANVLIPEKLGLLSNRYLPALCVLDPEGLELDWETVKACAGHRTHGTPYELLIYFSTPGAARTAGVRFPAFVEAAERRLDRVFGDGSWKPIRQLQTEGRLVAGEAGRRYRELYEANLKDLGYTTVMSRAANREDGVLVYHMVFASANSAGESIMTDAFKNAYGGQIPFKM